MRLRNRIVKATFWTDPELCRWSRSKRDFYRSLWACAEDSCCLEDDMFGVKMAAWPSPLDDDMSVEQFEIWRDEMMAESKPGKLSKLVRYEVEGEGYLYIPAMAQHERPRNPQAPDLPLPAWVTWVINDRDPRKGSYQHEPCTTIVQPLTGRPRPVLSCPDLTGAESRTREADSAYLTVCEIAEGLVGRALSPKEQDRCLTIARVHKLADVRIAAGVARDRETPTVAFLAGACDNLTPAERNPPRLEVVGQGQYTSPAELRAEEAEMERRMDEALAARAEGSS